MPMTVLTTELTREFGHLVPATLIESTVRTAAIRPDAAAADDGEVASTARADVEALAEAMRRRTESASSIG